MPQNSFVLICEGEHDALMAIQNGYRAVTNTSGAGCWKSEWNDWFAGLMCDIVVIYDPDTAGQRGAEKVCRELAPLARTLRSVVLPDGMDITDYFKSGKTGDDLQALIVSTPCIDQYKQIDITTGVDGQVVGHKLRWSASVVGKDLAPYLVPKRVTCKCTREKRVYKSCDMCGLEKTGEIKKEFSWDEIEVLLRCIESGDDSMIGQIKRVCEVVPYTACRYNKVDIDERQTIERVTLIPEADYSREDAKYSLRTAYFLGKDLDTNCGYAFKGTVLPDTNSQQAVMCIEDAVSVKDRVSRWHLSKEVSDELRKVFTPDEDTVHSYAVKLGQISHDLASHVTKIYGREYLVLSTLLTMHSALSFDFMGTRIQKGWLECAVVGDTETGKTETIKGIVYHARAGEFLTSGENVTMAGLLGGLQPSGGGQWTVTWGKIPFNDRGLVAIDEMENLSKEGLIGKLSGCRTSGIAEIVKIQTQRTMARTRIIWIANPVNGRMASYPFAVEAIMELFKEQQDVRRIDFAIGCRKEEISDEVINKRRAIPSQQFITSDLLHNSVMRAWNIKPEKVSFTTEAENSILRNATAMGAMYATDMPLMLGTGGRNKIARMAVALAILLYSTTDGNDVIVKETHVEYVVKFLHKLYDTNVLGFFDYSQAKKRKDVFHESHYIKDLFDKPRRCEEFLSSTGMKREDFEEIFNVDRDGARGIISKLREAGAIIKKYNFYNKSAHFVEWLRERRDFLREMQRDATDFNPDEYERDNNDSRVVGTGGNDDDDSDDI
jgi:hypothetical protein